MRRAIAAAGLTSLLALATVALSGPASADAPRDQGWWTATNPVPAPDVPAQGLLVQAGVSGPPTAFAALVYELDKGTTAQTLTLTIAPNTGTTPSATLQLCQLITPIVHADQGGPMSDAPAYNCSKKATAAPTGNAYKFDVSGLMADNLVPVAILPTGPVDRVVFSTPDANSLTTQQGTADTTAASPDLGITPDTSDTVATSSPEGLSSSPFVAAPSTDTGAPATSFGLPPQAPTTAATASGAPAGAFVPVSSVSPEEATPLLVLLLVGAGLSSAYLWFYAGRQHSGATVSG